MDILNCVNPLLYKGIKSFDITEVCIENDHKFVWKNGYYVCFHCGLVDDDRLFLDTQNQRSHEFKNMDCKTRTGIVKSPKLTLKKALKLNYSSNIINILNETGKSYLDKKCESILSILQLENSFVGYEYDVLQSIKKIVNILKKYKKNILNVECAFICCKYIQYNYNKKIFFPKIKINEKIVKKYYKYIRYTNEILYTFIKYTDINNLNKTLNNEAESKTKKDHNKLLSSYISKPIISLNNISKINNENNFNDKIKYENRKQLTIFNYKKVKNKKEV